jgi:hypothetical protein
MHPWSTPLEPGKLTKAKKPWRKTRVANLLRYSPSGVYFARVRVGSKLFRESLKTNVFTVAELRLADFINEKRSELGVETRADTGRITFGDALDIFRQRLDGDVDLKPGAKVYRSIGTNASRPC